MSSVHLLEEVVCVEKDVKHEHEGNSRKSQTEQFAAGGASCWTTPLISVLEGQKDLLRATSTFPTLGKLPPLEELPELKNIRMRYPEGEVYAVGCATAIVVVVVVVAVAARPGAVTSDDLLRAKLLDVYGPDERAALLEAIKAVQANPQLASSALGLDEGAFGLEFTERLDRVSQVLI